MSDNIDTYFRLSKEDRYHVKRGRSDGDYPVPTYYGSELYKYMDGLASKGIAFVSYQGLKYVSFKFYLDKIDNMLYIDKDSINLVRIDGDDEFFVAIRYSQAVLLYQPPKDWGVYPHAVEYIVEKDYYKRVNYNISLANVNPNHKILSWRETPPPGGLFFIRSNGKIGVGYRVFRKYHEEKIETALVVVFTLESGNNAYPFEVMHINNIYQCQFAEVHTAATDSYSREIMEVSGEYWRRNSSKLFLSKVFISDILKDTMLAFDFLESKDYILNVSDGIYNVFGVKRIIGGIEDPNIHDWYNRRRHDAAKNIMYNDPLRNEAWEFVEIINRDRSRMLSSEGLEYLRRLCDNTDKYINDLGV